MSFTDKSLPIAVIVVFIAVALSPILMGLAGKADAPKAAIADAIKGKECVEPAGWMRANHMQLLDEWRDDVVRDSNRTYTSNYKPKNDLKGVTTYDKSLTRTCLKCHDNKTKFCDRCHTYAGVKPYCWTCHVVPKEKI